MKEKFRNCITDLNSTIKKLDHTRTCIPKNTARAVHIKTADMAQHKMFTQIKHTPGYKASVNKFEKNEIMQSIFSGPSGIT